MKKSILICTTAALALPLFASAADDHRHPANRDQTADQTAAQVESNLQRKKSGPSTSGVRIVDKKQAEAEQGQQAAQSGAGVAHGDSGSGSR